jgi:uncharacterized protein (DUF1800 family)
VRNSSKLFMNRVAASFVAATFLCAFGIDLPSSLSAAPRDKKKEDPSLKNLPITELSAEEAIQHALNRLAYGPRPGDVERIKQMGLAKWIEQQLNPNSIDDKAVVARLENYPTLKMSSAKLIEQYPQPKQAAKKQGFTKEEAKQRQAEERREMEVAQKNMPSSSAEANTSGSAENADDGNSMKDAPSPMKEENGAGNPATRGQAGNNKLSIDPNAVPRAIADDSRRPQRVVEELAMAKVTRAIYSERQLQQVMDDFWFNHFNVYAAKGEVKWYLTSYERDVIQPHTLGKFKDLIEATAKSPAMLFYLDNFLSVDPRAQQRIAAERAARQANRRGFGWPPPPRPQQQKKQDRGLNENYGRELMELHTLGVDGGYTQKDVAEVARCFTGWTIEKPRQNPEFKFDERMHDPDAKMVLGKKIHSGGMGDGKQVIELLVKHPSTATFISTKLARRFVSDAPPQSLISKMSQTFQSTDGDIRAVMKTMIYSPEFWSREAFRAKIKTPYELVISAARALGTDVDTPMPLVQWTARIGQPLYQCQPPTGYSDKADAWVNTGALLNRLNYSLALAGNKVRGSHSDAATLLGQDLSADPKLALGRAVELFLGEAARGTVETLEKQVEDPQILQAKLDDPVKRVDMGVVAGLVLGAPEFQRR